MKLVPLARTVLLVAAAAFSFTGCGQADGSNSSGTTASGKVEFIGGTVAMGDENAPLVLEEFASVTCVHCMHFHEDVFPMLKAEYISTGLLRFEFNDFPTPPEDLAVAGFALARCTNSSEGYYKVVDDFFANRDGLIRAYMSNQSGKSLRLLAERNGMDDKTFEACLSDEAVLRAISKVIDGGVQRGVRSTPTLILNGEELPDAAHTADGMRKALDAKLAELGIEK